MKKNIVIVGAGIAGLRAALETSMSPHCKTVVLDKSPSVGGRVASRRFGDGFVNHGAQRFDRAETVFELDPRAKSFIRTGDFAGPATSLPKGLRDHLSPAVEFRFNWQVRSIVAGRVQSTQGDEVPFDAIILTAPIPQVEAILGIKIPGVAYSKALLFIGERNGRFERIEMDPTWSETHFELSDEEIIRAGEKDLEQDLSGLNVKKWRYSRVTKGLSVTFLKISSHVLVAGDAFDSSGKHDLASSWLSGLNAGRQLTKEWA